VAGRRKREGSVSLADTNPVREIDGHRVTEESEMYGEELE